MDAPDDPARTAHLARPVESLGTARRLPFRLEEDRSAPEAPLPAPSEGARAAAD